MQIHIVKEGETLYSVAQQYDTSIGFLARYNGLLPPYRLAVGQALLVLDVLSTVQVRPGDTLFSIAQAAGSSVLELLRRNPNLARQTALYPGQVLVTELESDRSRGLEVSGYAYPFAAVSVLEGILPYASILVPFTYGFTAEGNLVMLQDESLLSLAQSFSVKPFLHLSTLTENGTFSSFRAGKLLQEEAVQDTLISNVVQLMQEKGYRGLDVDFEYLGGELAAPYAAFLSKLHDILSPLGYLLYAALAPKTSDTQPGSLYEGHDYAAVANACDAVLVMTYEWGYTYGPPMAVAPIHSVRRVLDYALTRIPPEKLLMGFPNYAYDWTLPYTPGESRAKLIGNEDAPLLAVRYGAEIHYSEEDATPYFDYTDESGLAHEVWFEDPRSVQAKFDLLRTRSLRGVGYWNFMRPFCACFSLQNYFFTLSP